MIQKGIVSITGRGSGGKGRGVGEIKKSMQVVKNNFFLSCLWPDTCRFVFWSPEF